MVERCSHYNSYTHPVAEQAGVYRLEFGEGRFARGSEVRMMASEVNLYTR